MKKKGDGNMPMTVQERFAVPGDLGETNAVPRCSEHDLRQCPSRTRIGVWGDEQTFEVSGTGNKVTEGKNY